MKRNFFTVGTLLVRVPGSMLVIVSLIYQLTDEPVNYHLPVMFGDSVAYPVVYAVKLVRVDGPVSFSVSTV